jgi:CubicO group peptidase (beta-lactamase class C family)
MKHSFVYQSPDSVPRPAEAKYVRAIGYTKQRGQWQPNWGAPPVRQEQLLAIGDGGVWTNLEDLDAWDRTLRERELLKPNTWRLALTPSHTIDGKFNDYGCGWVLDLGEKNQVEGFGHNGAWVGFRTYFFRHYKPDYTLIVLSNRGDFDVDKFAGRMGERIIKAQAR